MSPLSSGGIRANLRTVFFAAIVAIGGVVLGLAAYRGYAATTPASSTAASTANAPNAAANLANDPWAQIEQFHNQMDQLFANTFKQGGAFNDQLGYAVPNMDLRDAKDHYEVVMDMPGADKGTIKVNVQGRLLSVSGQRNTSNETRQGNQVIRSERSSAQFERVVTLPGPVDVARLKTNYANGVLTIDLPKTEGKVAAASVAKSAQEPKKGTDETSAPAASPGTWSGTPFATQDPWDQLEQFHNNMDQLFANTFSQSDLNGLDQAQNFTVPAMDLRNRKDHYEVRMDMPGADKSTIKVNVEGRLLSVSGQRDTSSKNESGKAIRSERSELAFERTITLPGPVKVSAVNARYDNGVLSIDLPKAGLSASSTQVAVH